MAEGGTAKVPRPMTVAEFLAYDDGTDTRHELTRGELVAMAPPTARHARILRNLFHSLDRALEPPCIVYVGAGVAAAETAEEYRLPDLFVSCAPLPEMYFSEPRFLVEVLSPSTAKEDRTEKLDFYKSFSSAEAILFVWQDTHRVELHLRRDDGWLVTTAIGQGTVSVPGLGVALTLDEIYAGL